MNLHPITKVLKKDLIELSKDGALIFTLLIIPVLFSVIFPLLLFLFGTRKELTVGIAGLTSFLGQIKVIGIPDNIRQDAAPLYAIFTYFFLPLFMLIPVTIATILASSSFIGEKEHKTLEGLLYTPISKRNLILGKALSCGLPSILITVVAVFIYSILVNVFGWQYFGHIILPNFSWILVTVFISPLLVFLSILLIIWSSQYVKTSKSAQSVAMLLVAPIFGMIVSQSTGALIIGLKETVILIATLMILSLFLFLFVSKHFDFEKFMLNL